MIEIFISKYRENIPAYDAWGRFVTSEIIRNIKLSDEEKEGFLKVPAKHRLKKESSIRGKAERYGINNFSEDITDLIGVRFVVLLTSELGLIENAIQKCERFSWKKVRDYGVQADTNPELFDYQSIHYFVSPKENFKIDEISIDKNLICEVQIRTLLQHAYAELTHDNIYKPIHIVPSSARRLVARSMALMETTDELFCGTLESLRIANAPRNNLFSSLKEIYLNRVSNRPDLFDTRLNFEIIDTYREIIDFENISVEILNFFDEKDHLFNEIADQHRVGFLFDQPVVLLLHYLVEKNDFKVKTRWELMSLKEQLRIIFSNLGIAWGDDQ